MAINDLITKALKGIVETPFSKGLGYRTFKDLNITSPGSYVIKIVVPKNIILEGVDVSITSGIVKLETVVGGTAAGTFSETLPALSINTQTTVVQTPASVVLTAGGTHTGGTVIDVLSLKADSNAARATSVGAVNNDQRGVGPNTYYWRFTATGTDPVTGSFKAKWSEV